MGRTYGQHYLTEEQKQLAADNINLVWWYIKKLVDSRKIKPPEIDDVAGYLLWNLCMAAEKFDLTKNVKFSTYAIMAFKSGLSRYFDLKKRWEERFKIMSFEFAGEEETEYGYCYRPIREQQEKTIEWKDVEFLFDDVLLTPIEQQIKYYYHQERFSVDEIALILGYSGERIRQLYRGILSKVKDSVVVKGYTIEDIVGV